MRKQTLPLIGTFFLMVFCVSLWAQQKKGAKQADKATSKPAKKPAFVPVVNLGNSAYNGGPISVSLFDSLLRQGIQSRDQEGNVLSVIGFNFMYFDRQVYEDSAGDLHMMVDLSKEYCPGPNVTPNVAASIYDRIKGGDTVIIDQVLLTKNRPGQKADTFLGKGLKCVLTKNAHTKAKQPSDY